ncbi:MAG TPA: ABC transporter ATP-binding protein [Anaerolineales bacterium]|nr:ABC transporter ATP-binding protein [Anaerolineales bacterium]
MPILQTTSLTKAYPMGEVTVDALRNVHFEVAQGEFVAIMGPSGSGKSTLLHLLGGLDSPTDGEVILSGKRMAHLTDNEITLVRRRQVGFIFQFFNLLPTLSAAENIALPLLLDGKNIQEYTALIDDLLALVGLTDRRNHKPDQLSGGQQQRVAIARAFVNEPKIVLADEPTGNLDSKSGTKVLELLRDACKTLHTTVVMVTHDPRAASYADRVVFLKDGQIVRELANAYENAPAIIQVMAELEL